MDNDVVKDGGVSCGITNLSACFQQAADFASQVHQNGLAQAQKAENSIQTASHGHLDRDGLVSQVAEGFSYVGGVFTGGPK